MTLLRQAVLSALVLAMSPVHAVEYEINKNTTLLDDQGGSISTRSVGSLSSDISLIRSLTTFDDFLFQELPRIFLSGELSSTLSGGSLGLTYDLGGELEVLIGETRHQVDFDALELRRQGLNFTLEGHLLVDGEHYVVPPGGQAEDLIIALVILQGQ